MYIHFYACVDIFYVFRATIEDSLSGAGRNPPQSKRSKLPARTALSSSCVGDLRTESLRRSLARSSPGIRLSFENKRWANKQGRAKHIQGIHDAHVCIYIYIYILICII